MKLKRITGLLIIVLSLPGLAQEKYSFHEIDSLSYEAYLKSDWKTVRQLADYGFSAGYDYYYLRMRAGISFLNLKRAEQAVVHFRKALDYNRKDPDALAHLYLSLLSSANYPEARLMVDSIPERVLQEYGIPAPRRVRYVFLEPGYMFNGKTAELYDYRPEAEQTHHYLVPNYSYVGAGLTIEPQRRISLTLAANLLNFNAYQRFIVANNDPIIFEVPFDQRAFYASGSLYFGKGFTLVLAGQALSATYPLVTWQGTETGGSYVQKGYFYRDLALHLSVIKRFPYITVAARSDWNRFRDSLFIQAGADVTIYPYGNAETYIRGEGTWIMDSLNPSGRLIAQVTAGRRIFKSVWIEGYYTYGRIRNFSEKNAYVVYNNFDPIHARAGINLLFYGITRNLDLSLRYQWSDRTSSWQLYENNAYQGDESIHYPMHNLIGGIIWRF